VVKVRLIATAAASVIFFAGAVASAQPTPVRIGVVLKALDNPFFVAMFEGVRAETKQLDARASIQAARSDADRAGQAAHLRTLVAAKQDCYVVNPIIGTNLIPALRGARGPIVNIDSPVDQKAASRAGVRIRTFIGTNDFAAGKAAGVKMASLLPNGGSVALLDGFAGSVNSRHRLSGFVRGIQGTHLRVIAKVVANYSRTTAEVAAGQILRAQPKVSGFFAANDLMALGVADAVRAAGKAGRVKIIGVDGITEALDAVRAGSIDATVSQYPYVMGQRAVEACVAAARGAKVPAKVDSPVAVITKSNVARASATFPRPFRGYSDPFERILRSQG
jgi:ABC-type sugar transport system substrate-binding protein